MLRTLRKHNKWILVVGGSLLMVTFLISGTAGQLQPNPAKQTVATVGGEKVTAGDMNLAAREFEVLKALVGEGYLQNLGAMEDGNQWFLLAHEAQKAGLVGGATDGMDWIPAIARNRAPAYFRSIPPEQLQRELQAAGSIDAFYAQIVEILTGRIKEMIPVAGGQAGLNEQQVATALAKLRGVERLYELTVGAPRLSTARLALEASSEYDQATINAVILPVEPLAASLPEPTTEELQAQFDRFRAVAPGGPGLGFGYLQPPRVKMGWIALDRAAIASAIKLDPIAVNKYWQQNRVSFPGEYSAERPKVEDVLRSERADAMLAEIDRVLKARVNQATRSLDIDGARRVLPANWDRTKPTLDGLATDLVTSIKEFAGVDIPRPSVVQMDSRWIPIADLDALPGIGSSLYRSATAQLSLSELVARSQELSGAGDMDLQARVPFVSTPLVDQAGNRYYIEILDARRESVPESIDEVREQVARDARLAKAFERLSAEAPEFRVTATLQGLDAVASAFEARFPDTDVSPLNQIAITRSRIVSFLAQQLNDQDFRNAVIDAASSIPPTANLDESNVDARTIAKPIPAIRSVVVAQIVQREPVTIEALRSLPPNNVIELILRERMRTLQRDDTFLPESVSKRVDFVSREPGRRNEAPGAAPATDGSSPAGSSPAGTSPAGTNPA